MTDGESGAGRLARRDSTFALRTRGEMSDTVGASRGERIDARLGYRAGY
jgi:hypothetical protein